ncbi:uncharacterized protein LOC101692077 [Mustela putorius furo]|uniref:Uncharacterized protein LOC101692077 n=1 Tax=Mustela putorius furo TaxID=9669 RepID=A0A8U0S2W9_MUSPF|nr:uncharacterized protein LOC101692077 [Mustela putorius furo]
MCLRKQPPSGLYAVCGDSLASNQSQHADSKAGWCSFHDCGTGAVEEHGIAAEVNRTIRRAAVTQTDTRCVCKVTAVLDSGYKDRGRLELSPAHHDPRPQTCPLPALPACWARHPSCLSFSIAPGLSTTAKELGEENIRAYQVGSASGPQPKRTRVHLLKHQVPPTWSQIPELLPGRTSFCCLSARAQANSTKCLLDKTSCLYGHHLGLPVLGRDREVQDEGVCRMGRMPGPEKDRFLQKTMRTASEAEYLALRLRSRKETSKLFSEQVKIKF